MKVKELIKILSKLDQEKIIECIRYDGYDETDRKEICLRSTKPLEWVDKEDSEDDKYSHEWAELN